MNNNQMYENDIRKYQNIGSNKTMGNPIKVSYCCLTCMIGMILGGFLIFIGIYMITNALFNMDDVVMLIAFITMGICMIIGDFLIMVNRKLIIVEDRLIYTSMFKYHHSLSLNDIKEVKIKRSRDIQNRKIVIILYDHVFWINVYKDCPGYDEVKRYFCNKGMLTIDGMKISPY